MIMLMVVIMTIEINTRHDNNTSKKIMIRNVHATHYVTVHDDRKDDNQCNDDKNDDDDDDDDTNNHNDMVVHQTQIIN